MFAKIILAVSIVSMVIFGINKYSFRPVKKRMMIMVEYSRLLFFVLSALFGTVFVAVYAIENGRMIAGSLLEQYSVFVTGVLMVLMGVIALISVVLGLCALGMFAGWAKYDYQCEKFHSVLVIEANEVVLNADVDIKRENERRRVHRTR